MIAAFRAVSSPPGNRPGTPISNISKTSRADAARNARTGTATGILEAREIIEDRGAIPTRGVRTAA